MNSRKIISLYINGLNKELKKLKKTKSLFWGPLEYRKLDCLPEMIHVLEEWTSGVDPYNKQTQKTLDTLSNEISELQRSRQTASYPYGDYFYWSIGHLKKRFKGDLLQNFEKGDDNALFSLLKFGGINWLFGYPMQLRLLKAEAEEDESFFRNLANALRYGAKKIPIKRKKESDLLHTICHHAVWGVGLDFKDNSEVSRFYEGVKDFLDKWLEKLDEKPDQEKTKKDKEDVKRIEAALEILNDKNYFLYKWLKRQGLRYDRKKMS